MRAGRCVMLLSVMSLAGGCMNPGEPPAGPGATSATNLRPWLNDAPTVTWTGRLQYFHCTSERGNFYTWSLSPAGPEDANEVDIRACSVDAQRLEDELVTITGRLIFREPRHFPILVAQRLVRASPADAARVADVAPAPTRAPDAEYVQLRLR